jgi:predicted nucleotidyltransferase
MNSSSEDEWTTVVVKHSNKIFNKNNKAYNKTFEEIKQIILDVLLKYNPYGIYIYGSRARKTNRYDSDIDLMVFWKKIIPDDDNLKNIKDELFGNIKLSIDMINMFITNKINKVYNENDKCYYNNVINDAICIYETKSNNISDMIDMSIKLDQI